MCKWQGGLSREAEGGSFLAEIMSREAGPGRCAVGSYRSGVHTVPHSCDKLFEIGWSSNLCSSRVIEGALAKGRKWVGAERPWEIIQLTHAQRKSVPHCATYLQASDKGAKTYSQQRCSSVLIAYSHTQTLVALPRPGFAGCAATRPAGAATRAPYSGAAPASSSRTRRSTTRPLASPTMAHRPL